MHFFLGHIPVAHGVHVFFNTVKVAKDRSAFLDQHARIIIMARSKTSNYGRIMIFPMRYTAKLVGRRDGTL